MNKCCKAECSLVRQLGPVGFKLRPQIPINGSCPRARKNHWVWNYLTRLGADICVWVVMGWQGVGFVAQRRRVPNLKSFIRVTPAYKPCLSECCHYTIWPPSLLYEEWPPTQNKRHYVVSLPFLSGVDSHCLFHFSISLYPYPPNLLLHLYKKKGLYCPTTEQQYYYLPFFVVW